METDSRLQAKPAQDTHSILSEIEVAIDATDNQNDIDKLLWVRDMLREHITKGSHSVPMQ